MKKGFTLIELLAVIVILAIIALITVPIVLSALSTAQDGAYKNNEYAMTDAAVHYLAANDGLLPTGTNSVFIKLSELVNGNYIKNIVDPKSKTTCDTTYSGVKVTNNGYGNYTWTPYLNCTNYKGDNTAPIVKKSISGSNLTITATDDNALNFDSSLDYALVNASFPSTLTIEAWGFVNAYSIAGKMIWSFDSYASAYGVDIYPGCDKLNLNTNDGCGNPFSNSFYPSPYEWHHYAVVFDQTANASIFYLDGVQIGTALYRNPAGSKLYFGRYDSNSSYNWYGYIKDLRVWSTVRSASEIANNMNSVLMGNEPDLISYYKMDEMNGTKLIDLGFNKKDATVYNADWQKNSGVKEIRIKQGSTIVKSTTESKYTFTLSAGTYTIEVEDYAGRITTTTATI